jgi:NAD(P)-dependent dehydrogenase (short-subunit alcohol dehydrogenase family)
MPELEGKTVLITGSGSLGGIGADSALLFAQHGAEVLVAGRHTERGQRVVETILQAGGTARFLLADAPSPVLFDTGSFGTPQREATFEGLIVL